MMKYLKQAALGAALATLPLAASAQEHVLNAVSFAPKQAGITRGFDMFVKEINEKFEGELEIKWRGGPEVLPPFKQAEAVRNGAMDLTFTSPSYYSGLVPTSSSMNLSFKSYEELKAAGYYEQTEQLHAEKDLVFLGEVPATEGQFYIFLKEPIEKLEDLEGRRIRVFPTLLPLIESLGATPLVLPIGEIYTAMERGTIDGFVRGKTGWPEQFKGVVNYVVTPGVYRAGFPVLVNKKAWEELPEDLRARVKDFVRNDLSARIDGSWTEYFAKGDEQMANAGFQVIALDDAAAEAYREIAIEAAWSDLAAKADPDTVAELRAKLVD